jgi:hypothetical protein
MDFSASNHNHWVVWSIHGVEYRRRDQTWNRESSDENLDVHCDRSSVNTGSIYRLSVCSLQSQDSKSWYNGIIIRYIRSEITGLFIPFTTTASMTTVAVTPYPLILYFCRLCKSYHSKDFHLVSNPSHQHIGESVTKIIENRRSVFSFTVQGYISERNSGDRVMNSIN